MQQINSTNAVSQNTNTNYKKEEKKFNIKEKFNQIPDGTKKLGLALTALSVVAVAGVMIYKKGYSKALNTAQEELSGNRITTTIADVSRHSAEVKALKQEELSRNKIQTKIAKAELNEKNKQIAQSVQNSQKEAKLAKNVRQGMKNATSVEVIEAKIKASNEAAAKAQENAKKLEPLKNGTHKEKISAQRASNQAAIAQKEASITQQKGEQKIAELKRQAELKAKHIEEYKASPNYESGQQKMQENAKKTQENAAKRLSQKETQKAQKKFLGKNSNQLIAMYNSGKYNGKALSEVEKDAILNILEKKGIV